MGSRTEGRDPARAELESGNGGARWTIERAGDIFVFSYYLEPVAEGVLQAVTCVELPVDPSWVHELSARLRRWSDSRDLFGMSLSTPVGSISIQVGASSQLISTTDRPILDVSIRSSRLDLTFRMIIDETVCRAFADEIDSCRW